VLATRGERRRRRRREERGGGGEGEGTPRSIPSRSGLVVGPMICQARRGRCGQMILGTFLFVFVSDVAIDES
jgi:hypothetical protein